mmetsp:Transcript_13707/g.32634  ORF Transcript_13707/g.32634 Transcript_13707/m.32634 type:complete len:101 (+) Transcript_13707:664-966(+)
MDMGVKRMVERGGRMVSCGDGDGHTHTEREREGERGRERDEMGNGKTWMWVSVRCDICTFIQTEPSTVHCSIIERMVHIHITQAADQQSIAHRQTDRRHR